MTPDSSTDDPDARDGAIEHEDDIDWHEIIDTTESDYRRCRFAFNSADCETEEEVTRACWLRRDHDTKSCS